VRIYSHLIAAAMPEFGAGWGLVRETTLNGFGCQMLAVAVAATGWT
jgi:hypothetical protein